MDDSDYKFYPETTGGGSRDCQTLIAEIKDAELGDDGSYEFEVPLPSGPNSWGSLQLEASVVETATGL